MIVIKANSPTDAWVKSHEYLLKSGNKNVMNESINMAVEIENNFNVDASFDNLFREIFGNDPDAFTNIFHTNEDGTEFIYPDLVSNFWNKYFTTTGQRHIRN